MKGLIVLSPLGFPWRGITQKNGISAENLGIKTYALRESEAIVSVAEG